MQTISSRRARNAKKEEALSQTLKKFTNLTFNHHLESVIDNAPTKTEAESILTQQANKFTDIAVVFLANNENIGVKQHHFRLSYRAEVCTYIKSCGEKC